MSGPLQGPAELPARPVDPTWLALREPADARSRNQAVKALLPPLLARLTYQSEHAPRVVDLGAGTGANLRWLAPLLPEQSSQQWTLVDHDPRLLAQRPVATVAATSVQADVADLAQLLTSIGGADLITASALLDLLDDRQLTAIVEVVVEAKVSALFSLNVTGEVNLEPSDLLDASLASAFDAHQRRGCRRGPDAAEEVAAMFRARRWPVVEADTPWVLEPRRDSELIHAWLDGRAGAAVQQQPHLAPAAAGWLERRKRQLRTNTLSVIVRHTDILAQPAP